jgi:hypothetical protein
LKNAKSEKLDWEIPGFRALIALGWRPDAGPDESILALNQ